MHEKNMKEIKQDKDVRDLERMQAAAKHEIKLLTNTGYFKEKGFKKNHAI